MAQTCAISRGLPLRTNVNFCSELDSQIGCNTLLGQAVLTSSQEARYIYVHLGTAEEGLQFKYVLGLHSSHLIKDWLSTGTPRECNELQLTRWWDRKPAAPTVPRSRIEKRCWRATRLAMSTSRPQSRYTSCAENARVPSEIILS